MTLDQFHYVVNSYKQHEQISALGEEGSWVYGGGNTWGFIVLYHHRIVRLSLDNKITPDMKNRAAQALKQMLTKI